MSKRSMEKGPKQLISTEEMSKCCFFKKKDDGGCDALQLLPFSIEAILLGRMNKC